MQPGHNEAAIVFWEGFPETKPCHEAVVATRSGVSFKADSGRALRLGGFATVMLQLCFQARQPVARMSSGCRAIVCLLSSTRAFSGLNHPLPTLV